MSLIGLVHALTSGNVLAVDITLAVVAVIALVVVVVVNERINRRRRAAVVSNVGPDTTKFITGRAQVAARAREVAKRQTVLDTCRIELHDEHGRRRGGHHTHAAKGWLR